MVGISESAVNRIMTKNLEMKKLCTRFLQCFAVINPSFLGASRGRGVRGVGVTSPQFSGSRRFRMCDDNVNFGKFRKKWNFS